MSVPVVTFNALPNGAYFRLDDPEFADCRCRKVYAGHFVQLKDDPCGLTDEHLVRRLYGDFRVIPMEKPDRAEIRALAKIKPGDRLRVKATWISSYGPNDFVTVVEYPVDENPELIKVRDHRDVYVWTIDCLTADAVKTPQCFRKDKPNGQ